MKKVLGGLALLMGVGILIWIGYNYLIEMQPEAEGRNPIPAILISIAFIYFGQKWIRGKQRDKS